MSGFGTPEHMNRFEENDLDRMIAALPLAEPPAGFRARA